MRWLDGTSTGDMGSIPESGRFTGEGTGYPLHHSWASLVAQLVKNLPAMLETRVSPPPVRSRSRVRSAGKPCGQGEPGQGLGALAGVVGVPVIDRSRQACRLPPG